MDPRRLDEEEEDEDEDDMLSSWWGSSRTGSEVDNVSVSVDSSIYGSCFSSDEDNKSSSISDAHRGGISV